MDTKTYIETLKSNSKKPNIVAMRQALIYYLRRENITAKIVAEVLGITRRVVYHDFYKTRDLLFTKDEMMRNAYDEISNHTIVVRPCMVEAKVIMRIVGYKLIIDNITY